MQRKKIIAGAICLVCSLLLIVVLFLVSQGSLPSDFPPNPFGGQQRSVLKGALQDIGAKDNRRIMNVTFDANEATVSLGKDLYFVRLPKGPFPMKNLSLAGMLPGSAYRYYGYKYTSPSATIERDMQARSFRGEPLSFNQMFPGQFFYGIGKTGNGQVPSVVDDFQTKRGVVFAPDFMVSLDEGALYVIVIDQDDPAAMTMRYENPVCGNGVVEFPEQCDSATDGGCSSQCRLTYTSPALIITQESLGAGTIDVTAGQLVPVIQFIGEAKREMALNWLMIQLTNTDGTWTPNISDVSVRADTDLDGTFETTVIVYSQGGWSADNPLMLQPVTFVDSQGQQRSPALPANSQIRFQVLMKVPSGVEAGKTFRAQLASDASPNYRYRYVEGNMSDLYETQGITTNGGPCVMFHGDHPFTCDTTVATVPSPTWRIANTPSGDGCRQDSDCGDMTAKGCYSGQCLYFCDEPPQNTYPDCPSGACTQFSMSSSACAHGAAGGSPVCGNGHLEDGEQCDDGNTVDGDGCSANCTTESSGTSCHQDSDCGDMLRKGCYSGQCLYFCDEPPQEGYPPCPSGVCTSFSMSSSACTVGSGYNGAPVCGNGQVETGEQCDDGNTVDGDGCSANCTTEQSPSQQCPYQCCSSCYGSEIPNYSCTGTSNKCCDQCAPVCGNGQVEMSEQCDDGNTVDGDGCLANCTTETPNYCMGQCCTACYGIAVSGTCPGTGQVCCDQCAPVCGNGQTEMGEQCDDGNTVDGDGCSANCTTETPNYCMGECCTACYGAAISGTCPGTGQVCCDRCGSTCGNGQVETGEQCDDGRGSDGDGCSANCTVESGWYCYGSPSYCLQMGGI
jgi:cysteine-rich repeat protein